MKLFVGIDVSSKDMKACLMNQEGETLSTLTVANNLPGATELRDAIVHTSRVHHIKMIQIGMEATSVYSYYSKKYREVPKHQHKRALVLTARKLVRLIDALLRNNQIYVAQKGEVTR